ncbi:MAG TPA: Flp pilus assembly protein CpaB, partial [Gammaproteobacteria bacterium]|nr:Flp pilus assembly protein CpaB [Gammaproteobacteria bacterium]
YLTQNYIEQTVEQEKAELTRGQEMIEIVVANRALKPGDIVDLQSVSKRKIPVNFIPTGAISVDQFNKIQNTRLIFPVGSGDPILEKYVSHSSTNSFSNLLEPGQRALTIPVDTLDSISGFLSPGDYVDFLVTVKDNDVSRTVPLLSDVRILATGKKLGSDNVNLQRVIDQNSRVPTGNAYREVTVAVNPRDASRLIHAQSVGTLTLTMRSGEDRDTKFKDSITIENLVDYQIAAPKAQVKQETSYSFEIIERGE